MTDFRIYKEVSTVPVDISPDSMYAVRTGPGFDLFLSDATGSVAYKINDSLKVSEESGNTLELKTDGLYSRKESASNERYKIILDSLISSSPASTPEDLVTKINLAVLGSQGDTVNLSTLTNIETPGVWESSFSSGDVDPAAEEGSEYHHKTIYKTRIVYELNTENPLIGIVPRDLILEYLEESESYKVTSAYNPRILGELLLKFIKV